MPHLCARPLPGSDFCNLGRETAIQKMEWREDGWLTLAGGGRSPLVEVSAPELPVHPWPEVAALLPFDSIEYATPRMPSQSVIRDGGRLRLLGMESIESTFEQAMLARRLTKHQASKLQTERAHRKGTERETVGRRHEQRHRASLGNRRQISPISPPSGSSLQLFQEPSAEFLLSAVLERLRNRLTQCSQTGDPPGYTTPLAIRTLSRASRKRSRPSRSTSRLAILAQTRFWEYFGLHALKAPARALNTTTTNHPFKMKKILNSPDSDPGKTRLRDSVAGSRKTILVSLLAVGTASLGTAAVINPQIGGSIDPAGAGEIDYAATGSVSLATFESTTSGRVIQANWNGMSGTTGNTINHDPTDGGFDDGVDVRIVHSPGIAPSTDATSTYNTSTAGNGYRWTGENGQTVTISFGTASGPSNQIFTNDRTVKAAGLVLLNFGAAYTNVAITYFDSANNALSSQSFAGGGDLNDSSGGDFFTGYVSDSANIAYLTIGITRNAGTSSIGLDALTFAQPNVVIPEPSSMALLGLGGFGLLSRRRRSAKLEPTVPA